ncbi:hypothetical protein CLV51_1052 [Chitinophaga niastensis]|uniref:Endosialidase-like protein n=1 Tax=Chitinophaga niastensis TaxID=536980 RepID=A0A2P8HEI2_CHINA|nr:hypothetical protein [Chitinophaga niastensis]PSL44630.1 hypothetical protein CLV51_1052 [Chitinophaga niastensis]
MKRKILQLIPVFFCMFTSSTIAQNIVFDTLTARVGGNKSIIWTTSTFGTGFGHKIYSYDPGGRTDLRIAARNNSATWTDVMNITSLGNVGIGTTSPSAGLHVTQVSILPNGDRAAAILGNAYNDWTYFGGNAGGKIRGSNEGYLVLETNPGSNNAMFINSVSSGNILMVNGGGNVGIGTNTTNGYKLAVNGIIGARRVKVEQITWADFVFQSNYELPSLQYVENFIQKNNHLPDIPSAQQVKEDGLDLGEMNKQLLQKVEELTLYIIELNKRMALQEKKMDALTK